MGNCMSCFSERRQQPPVSGSVPPSAVEVTNTHAPVSGSGSVSAPGSVSVSGSVSAPAPASRLGSATTSGLVSAPAPASGSGSPTTSGSGSATTSVSAPTKEEVIQSLKAVSDPTDLKEFVGIIKQLLEKKKSDSASTSESAKENKGMFASFVKSGANCLNFVHKQAEDIGDKKEILSSGKSKVVAEILGKIGELNWVVGALSIAAYLIDKCEKVSDNKAAALELLTNIVDLATTIFKLRDVIPEERENSKNAVMLLVQGSIMCVSQKDSPYISRFLKTGVNSEDLKQMSNKIKHLYDHLNMEITTAIVKRQPILLPVRKPFYPEYAVGIEKAQEEVIKMLNMSPQDESTLAVVIYGVGGIGKTTLATSVVAMLNLDSYNLVRVYLDEDKNKNDLKKKQEEILKDGFPSFHSGARIELRDCQEGRERLQEAFLDDVLRSQEAKNNPVFLFIDNALRSQDLKELLPKYLSKMPKRSRILLTTRKLDTTDFLLTSGIKRCEFAMKTLDEGQAAQILCKDPDKLEYIKDDMERILRICGGVPLALTIVSGQLVKNRYNVNKCGKILDTLEKGDNVKEEDLTDRLVNLVYNELDASTKDAFLDICCFFNGWSRSGAEDIEGEEEVQSLEEAALVTTSVGEYFGKRLSVHDVVRARGRTISKSTRFTDVESLRSFLQTARDEEIQQIKGIWLADDHNVLSLEAKHVDLMSRSLRILCLEKNSLESLPENFGNLSSLKMLSLNGLPESFGKLSSLQTLEMNRCEKLESLPESFGKLSSLQTLEMHGCKKLESLPERLPESLPESSKFEYFEVSDDLELRTRLGVEDDLEYEGQDPMDAKHSLNHAI